MVAYRRSARPRFTLLLLVLTAVTILTVDYRGPGDGVLGSVKSGARDAFAPVQDAADGVLDPVRGYLGGVLHYRDLEAENARLRSQLAGKEGEVLRAADAAREREVLLAQQNLDFVGDLPRIAARVISASTSNFEQLVELDRGRDAGITKGMPVVTGAGLVGRVVDASNRRAMVLLVTDSTSSVGIRLTGSGDVGVATGAGARNPLTADLIDAATPVAEGEVVVTSGLRQSVFPPNIPVGRVRDIRPGPLQQDLTIDPVVDLRRLTFVSVLVWSPR
ncbi:MAG: rod shape-determining protein MreC [Acidimicrobiales bacterium]